MDADGLRFHYVRNVLDVPDAVLQQLETEIEYCPADESFVEFGEKIYPIPRQHVGYGDDGLRYRFSGMTLHAKPWTPLLLRLKSVVESITGQSYNFVVINRYSDGTNSISPHSDDEAQLEDDHSIACLSLGAEREIVFSRKRHSPVHLVLEHNSLLTMLSPTNRLWRHGIPKDPKVRTVRISLTFRKMKISTRRCKDKQTLCDIINQPDQVANRY